MPNPTPPPIDVYRRHAALCGAELQADIDKTPEVRPAYIDELVLEESVVMVASPPGQGKSCLLLTMIAHASTGAPVFGALNCPRPLRCYVFCPERSARELKERFRKMQRYLKPNMDNICFDDGMHGLIDINNPKSKDAMFREMDRHGHFDILFIEGLYGMSRLPLAKEETANIFYRWQAEVHTKMGCSIWESHHTKKIQRNWKGEELPPEWFGSQFLMANATAAYLFQRQPEANKSVLTMGKDTVSGLANRLSYTFDPESFVMTLDVTNDHVTAKERFRTHVNHCLTTGKPFTYDDISKLAKVSQSTVTRTIMTWVRNGAVSNINGPGQKGLYKVLAPV